MARNLSRIILLSLMLFGGIFGLRWYETNSSDGKYNSMVREKDEIISAERQKNQVLRSVLKRLQTDKRIARLVVQDQTTENGQTRTTLAFSEYDPEGKNLLQETYRTFTLDGTTFYLAAYIVEFDDSKVVDNDPLRGHSIAIFQRLFGEKGSVEGYELRSAGGEMPRSSSNPEKDALEKQVWTDFWKLSDDSALRKQYGVKNAVGKTVFSEKAKPGVMYTVTLDPRGNLSMISEPIDPLILKSQQGKKNATPTTKPNS